MADPIHRARQSVCTVPSEPFGGKPSALCDAGSDPVAPPHEPDLPGNSAPKSRPGGIQIDRKRLKKLQEKRMALGHKPAGHEEQWPDMTM